MTTTTEPTTEEALWLYIGEMPECGHRRQYAADWFEDRAGKVECLSCGGRGYVRGNGGVTYFCPRVGPECTGYIPDRNGRLAAALRATAVFWPMTEAAYDGMFVNGREIGDSFWWYRGNLDGSPEQGVIPEFLYDALTGKGGYWRASSRNWLFPTAAAAIRDLCEAWCKVTYGEVGE